MQPSFHESPKSRVPDPWTGNQVSLEPEAQQSDLNTKGIAATGSSWATGAALEMLRQGGNAIDAAVAAAWAMAVCDPSASGLGGQTTMLLRLSSGQITAINGHSKAPAAVSLNTVNPCDQSSGYRAATVPTTPGTLDYAQQRYGRLPAAKVLEPAIRLAQEGFPITPLYRRTLESCLVKLRRSESSSHLLLKKGRHLFGVGEIFSQPRLASTLRRLAEQGIQDFYFGGIARAIEEDMAARGGLMTSEDLATSAVPVECDPWTTEYRGHIVLTTPPPGGGLQMLVALKLLEHLELSDQRKDEDAWREMLAAATALVFQERERNPVHPDEITASFRDWLLSEQRSADLAETLRRPSKTTLFADSKEEPGETTHLCTADSEGNVVSLTQSVQSLFGAKVAQGELGFLYNNYLMTCPRHPHPYQLGACCFPQSNVAPTFLLHPICCDFKEDPNLPATQAGLRLALGAGGSRRIISSLLHVISGVIDRGFGLAEAVAAPRVHGMANGKVWVEESALAWSLRSRLSGRFRKIVVKSRQGWDMGAVKALGTNRDGQLAAVADPRRDGSISGSTISPIWQSGTGAHRNTAEDFR